MGALRNFNLDIPGSTPYDEFLMRLYLNYGSADLQLLPGDPPNVAGWQAFRQSPSYYRVWINGATMRNRNVITDVLCFYYIGTDNDQLAIDHIAFAQQFAHPEPLTC